MAPKDGPEFPEEKILECSHCGNRTPHSKEFQYDHSMLYDEVDWGQGEQDDELDGKLYDRFTWLGYACGTCGGLNLYGAFVNQEGGPESLGKWKLHPRGADLLPPAHMMSPNQPIPPKMLAIYREVWPLRHRSPTAFVGQIRRLLEFVCADQEATGKDLFAKLKDLSSKGVLPGYFSEITTLLRKVGNMGAHAADEELTIWDAELIDDFFRATLEYVYVAPAKIRRMESRLKQHDKKKASKD